MPSTKLIARFTLHAVTFLCLVMLSACSSTGTKSTKSSSGTSPTSRSPVAAARAKQCPLTHIDLGPQAASRTFADYEIVFLSEAEASSFDELPGEKKRVVAGRQVLAHEGVENELCIMTEAGLPIDAIVIEMYDVRFGFVDESARQEFDSISEEERLDLASPYLLQAAGIENTLCPVSGAPLHPDCPTIEIRDVRIGFKSKADLEKYKSMSSGDRSELVAFFVLQKEGVRNVLCPVSKMPLRLDSPVVTVDGVSIALRNVDAARTFNQMSSEQKRKAIEPNEL